MSKLTTPPRCVQASLQVHIPPDTRREEIFHTLKKLNSGIRAETYFAGMKRSNRSAMPLLHFMLPLRNWSGAKVDYSKF